MYINLSYLYNNRQSNQGGRGLPKTAAKIAFFIAPRIENLKGKQIRVRNSELIIIKN